MSAVFQGYINNGTDGVAGTTLHVTSMTSGAITLGMVLTSGSTIPSITYVSAFISGTGTNNGGTYTVNYSQNSGTSTGPITIAGNMTTVAANDFNTIQAAIAGIYGKVPAGYGQNLSTFDAAVATGAKITTAQWNALQADITAVNWHQLNAAPVYNGNPLTTATNTVKVRQADRAAYLAVALALSNPSPTTIGGVSYPGCYVKAATNQFTNPVPGASENDNSFPAVSVRNQSWGNTSSGTSYGTQPSGKQSVICETTLTFTAQGGYSANQIAEWFFQSGSSITFSGSRQFGTVSGKNTSWTALLNNMGTISFSYSGVTATGNPVLSSGGSGLTTYGWNWFNNNKGANGIVICTNSLGTTGSSLYAPNQYTLTASIDATGSILTFIATFSDLSTAYTKTQADGATGGNPNDTTTFSIDDPVDGTLTSIMNVKYATGPYVDVTAYLPTVATPVLLGT